MQRTTTTSRLLRSFLLAAACAAVPQTAGAADLAGNPGYVQELVINSSKSDRFIEFQGSVVLVEGDAANAPKKEYRWGGTSCPNYQPTDMQLAYMFDVLRSARALQIVPSYKAGTAGTRCLVSLKVRTHPASAAPL